MAMAFLCPTLVHELAHRLEEGEALDVADRPADLGDDHVILAGFAERLKAPLDLVGDVGDDLDGRAEVVAAALLRDHLVIDLTGGGVVLPRGGDVEEALVVPEVQIGLRAVVGHVHLAVLERIHRARVDVQVGVELLDRDAQAARFQQQADGRRCDALAERRDHAAGDEDVFDLSLSCHRNSPFTFGREARPEASPGARCRRREPVSVLLRW